MKSCLVFFTLFLALAASYNVYDAINDAGYKYEKYQPVTSDGFKLTVVRITAGLTPASKGKNKPAVFLQHGLLDQCGTWVAQDPSQSLGFILSDAGYDVYLGNVRGNRYSLENTKLKPSDGEYWRRIDYDYMISEDIPTMINEALRVSKRKTLTYVGHSQGTLVGFGAFSYNQDIVKKVNLFVALAPVAYVGNIEVPMLKLLADLELAKILEWFGEAAFLPPDWFLKMAAPLACRVTPTLCEDVLGYFCGQDASNLNVTALPHIMSLEPGGTSVQNMVHWSQGVYSNKFQRFDFGSASENIKHYGVPQPPIYNLTAINDPPIAIFSGSKDLLADPDDVQVILKDLPKPPVFNLNIPTYEHLDFVWGVNANQLIYPSVLKLIKKYNP